MKRFLLLLAAVAITGLLLPAGLRPAYACSCVGYSPEEKVANADVIAIGTVSRIFDNPYTIPDPKRTNGEVTLQDVDAVVSVERYLKGTGPAEIVADDPQSGGGCGIFEELSVGSRYLLFLTGTTSPFTTNLCSGSLPIEGPGRWTLAVSEEFAANALEEVQAITGPGTLPQDSPPPSQSPTDDGIPWLAIIIGSSLAAGALLAASALLLRYHLTRG